MTKDKGHTSAVIGTLMGLGVMIFTNFLIDVPLTDKFTNLFTKHAKKKGNIKDTNPKYNMSKPSFKKSNLDGESKEQLKNLLNKIQVGELLPPMSQVNMEVIKWGA